MRRLKFTSLFLLIIQFFCSAQYIFHIPGELEHFRLDFNTAFLWKDTDNGKWVKIGKLSFENVNIQEIPINNVFNAFNYHQQHLLTIPGTGQVYLMDRNKMILKRIDKTFYRGYNFEPIQFLRKDTLFSVGGVGFWHGNNISTFFSFTKNEWEMTSLTNKNKGPKRLRSSYGGYDENRDILCAIEFPELYDQEDQQHKYFEKKLKNNEWTYLGDLNTSLLHQLGIDRLDSQFLNGYYFFTNSSILVWADPQNNGIYQLDNVGPIFNSKFEIKLHKGSIYTYERITPTSNEIEFVKKDSISIQKLRSISTYKGPFYQQGFSYYYVIGGVLLITILLTLVVVKIKKNLTKIPSQNNSLDGLPLQAISFLKACLNYEMGYMFSSMEITELMGYNSYSYETQKQFRSKMIKEINMYFFAHFQLKDVIVRTTAPDDKRFSAYMISDIHYQFLINILK